MNTEKSDMPLVKRFHRRRWTATIRVQRMVLRIGRVTVKSVIGLKRGTMMLAKSMAGRMTLNGRMNLIWP